MEQVRFWKSYENGVRLPYAEFTNFAKYPFTVDGVAYPTSEHYYQSKKFIDPEYRSLVIESPTPKSCAEIGRNKYLPLRPDWEEIKDDVMRMALWHKFSAHLPLVKSLLDTEDKEIIEDTPIDWYWGCGADGTGKNMLGKLLMELRENIKTGDPKKPDIKEY